MNLDFSKPAPIREFVRNYMQHRSDVTVRPVDPPAPVSALPSARANRVRDTWLAHDVMIILLAAGSVRLCADGVTALYRLHNELAASEALTSAIRRILRRAVADGRATRTGRGTMDDPYRYQAVNHGGTEKV